MNALKSLRRHREGPPPPPHALLRLARWHIEKGLAKRALLPLRLFLDLYPAHQDGPEAKRDYALALHGAGKTGEAKTALIEASRAGVAREARRRETAERDAALTGRLRQHQANAN